MLLRLKMSLSRPGRGALQVETTERRTQALKGTVYVCTVWICIISVIFLVFLVKCISTRGNF